MLKLHAIQAAFGDCFLLESGTAGSPKFILIDGGPKNTWSNHLRESLATLLPAGTPLELVVLSHVDNDHVLGLLDFFSEKRAGAAVPDINGLWHNSFSKTIGNGNGVEARFQALMTASRANVMANAGLAINGIKEGSKLRLDALALGIPINSGFPHDLIRVDDAPSPITVNDLTIRVTGPTQANLDELKSKWEKWLDDHEDGIMSGNVQALANSDHSVPNLSSIAFVIESQGKTLLFTGDGRSDHLLQGLAKAGLLDGDGKLHVDYFKVAHHGSKRNATEAFFSKVTANHYVISADGTNDNPDFDTLTWIVKAAKEAGRSINLHVTNSTPATERLLSDFDPDEYGYKLNVMPDADHYYTISIA